ncbi:hypothetical protein EDD22DRAFT_845373 [Suillus occidentalis]|nr:hypothetical protein EDD22DRAFT_845373 [Suillus occidentalis]
MTSNPPESLSSLPVTPIQHSHKQSRYVRDENIPIEGVAMPQSPEHKQRTTVSCGNIVPFSLLVHALCYMSTNSPQTSHPNNSQDHSNAQSTCNSVATSASASANRHSIAQQHHQACERAEREQLQNQPQATQGRLHTQAPLNINPHDNPRMPSPAQGGNGPHQPVPLVMDQHAPAAMPGLARQPYNEPRFRHDLGSMNVSNLQFGTCCDKGEHLFKTATPKALEFQSNISGGGLSSFIFTENCVIGLTLLLDNHWYGTIFWHAYEILAQHPDDLLLSIHLLADLTRDHHQYNLPSAREIAAIILGNGTEATASCNIILHR